MSHPIEIHGASNFDPNSWKPNDDHLVPTLPSSLDPDQGQVQVLGEEGAVLHTLAPRNPLAFFSIAFAGLTPLLKQLATRTGSITGMLVSLFVSAKNKGNKEVKAFERISGMTKHDEEEKKKRLQNVARAASVLPDVPDVDAARDVSRKGEEKAVADPEVGSWSDMTAADIGAAVDAVAAWKGEEGAVTGLWYGQDGEKTKLLDWPGLYKRGMEKAQLDRLGLSKRGELLHLFSIFFSFPFFPHSQSSAKICFFWLLKH